MNPPDADDEGQTYLEILADYECPDGCDFLSVIYSDDEAADLLGGDANGFVRCPLCEEELELTVEAALDMLDFIAERLARPASR